MKPEEINIAIALHLGWKREPSPHDPAIYSWWNPEGEFSGRYYSGDAPDWIPDYTGDLNAMAEAKQSLWAKDNTLRAVFVDHLARILNPVHGYRMQSAEDLLDATARDEAEAFCRTVGIWKEGGE